MSHVSGPAVIVGNDFVVTPRARQIADVAAPKRAFMPPALPMQPATLTAAPAMAAPLDFTPAIPQTARRFSPFHTGLNYMHRYSVASFALLFLLVGSTGVQVSSRYWTAHTAAAVVPVAKPAKTIAGLNLTVPANQLADTLHTITAQSATITVGGQALPIDGATIQSWLQVTPSADKSKDYIRIKADAMTTSLNAIATKYVKAPVNQVTATYADGSSAVIVAGQNGTALTDPNGLKQQAAAAAKTVMDGKGLQFNAPLQTQAYAAVTPAAFNKLIEVNVSTKQMYLYDNGKLSYTYAISAGAPVTPTPLGEFHIYSKLPVQDMSGYNADGSKYLQPHVHWINYFLPGGYAVHGNYWRPLSVFGAVNTSHGCVSLPDAEAEQVYDWAPLGTTVITHA